MKFSIPFQFRSIPSYNSKSNSMACNSNSNSGIGVGIAINSNSISELTPTLYALVNGVIIGSNDYLSPVVHQAFTWTNELLSIESLGTTYWNLNKYMKTFISENAFKLPYFKYPPFVWIKHVYVSDWMTKKTQLALTWIFCLTCFI